MAHIILDLCGGTGAWSAPYRAAGYDVRLVTLPDLDVRTYTPPDRVHGILAAPPCTEFARCGARWWATKPPERLAEAVDVVRACLALVKRTRPAWWALENPIGRIARCVPELGAPLLRFDPHDYGDRWTKRTWIWGHFRPPFKLARPGAIDVDVTTRGRHGMRQRSVTPPGFAQAFFEANS